MRRGEKTDEVLAFLQDCFASDEVTAHGQTFLFKPRPERPPIYVGGAPPHALARAARYGDGWMPMGGDPDSLKAPIAELRSRFEDAGRGVPEVVCMLGLPLGDVVGPAVAASQTERLRVVREQERRRWALIERQVSATTS